ncbi:type I methionyl aminopeptidase [Candidatus Peregrinibacteria bacterium]|nr:type I methionyl aminopeptidase [Candidatus Peregrinibacteria bacterium]
MKLMREAGRILGIVLSEIEKTIKPGVTTLELDQLAEKMIRSMDAVPSFIGYNGFKHSICACINEEVVHGIPSNRAIKAGDLVTVDCGVTYKGFIADSAISVALDGADQKTKKLLSTAYKALEKAIDMAKPGLRTSEFGKIIEKTVRKEGFGIVEDLSGHGIGVHLHEDPYILNYDNGEEGPIMQPGMTFAIEPIITIGSPKTKTLKDGWTIVTQDGSMAVQVEHTIAITEKGAEILTKRPK